LPTASCFRRMPTSSSREQRRQRSLERAIADDGISRWGPLGALRKVLEAKAIRATKPNANRATQLPSNNPTGGNHERDNHQNHFHDSAHLLAGVSHVSNAKRRTA
jgi:hypothetical protein